MLMRKDCSGVVLQVVSDSASREMVLEIPAAKLIFHIELDNFDFRRQQNWISPFGSRERTRNHSN